MTEEASRRLRAVGEALHVAKNSGHIVAKLDFYVPPSTLLYDERGRIVGKIAELIGPVRAPYASIIPQTDRVKRGLGRKLCASI